MLTLSQIKTALRSGPFAWPGGYPVFFIMGDGEPASFDAVRAEWPRICRAYISSHEIDWFVTMCAINWENPDLICCISNEPIPAAYA